MVPWRRWRELIQLSEYILQASSPSLAKDIDENPPPFFTTSERRLCRDIGAFWKISKILNSLIGHPGLGVTTYQNFGWDFQLRVVFVPSLGHWKNGAPGRHYHSASETLIDNNHSRVTTSEISAASSRFTDCAEQALLITCISIGMGALRHSLGRRPRQNRKGPVNFLVKENGFNHDRVASFAFWLFRSLNYLYPRMDKPLDLINEEPAQENLEHDAGTTALSDAFPITIFISADTGKGREFDADVAMTMQKLPFHDRSEWDCFAVLWNLGMDNAHLLFGMEGVLRYAEGTHEQSPMGEKVAVRPRFPVEDAVAKVTRVPAAKKSKNGEKKK
ncbi:hypothetical protein HPP92_016610 [Vanilla planifolia]|uniref:Uncharacterized protein n=1 Tax=Vanilla planifolia TaxID=51239 RepID=A0A835QLT3_VANPL|nr:hypothetical protein HPP92_016610 [Vanilla planifolia]